MKDLFIQPIQQLLKVELEAADSMDGYIEQILPKIVYTSDDFHDLETYVNKRWMDVNPRMKKEMVLRIFQYEGDTDVEEVTIEPFKYIHTNNGNVSNGSWTILKSKSMILHHDISKELYDLHFLNDSFMVLKKHGVRAQTNSAQYRLLATEEVVGRKGHMKVIESLFDIYRYNLASLVFMGVIIAVVVIIFILSFV